MTTIEDGFLAAEAAIILVIMLWSGWNHEAAGGLKVMPAAAAFILFAFLGQFQTHGQLLKWNGSAIGLLLLAAWIWRKLVPPSDRVYTLGCAFLLGFLQIWLGTLYGGSPQLVIIREGWDAAIISGALASLLTLRVTSQVVVLAGSAALVSLYPVWAAPALTSTVIGGAAWWDKLALAAFSCRLASLAVQALAASLGRVMSHQGNHPEGEA
ncbi:hypothetical protein [Paenibacillus herberti]|uniref:Uncharacterized protein n=1 Tax=Paenibacillus herberti TaxID=1619309 RepID=A0A229P3H9_9BACL|nr:hypothetical protein [Paenibacillus herberti]OXM16670.1 hypothetical protein CGZ75_08425 [Paenibacillus herberti]